MNMSKRFAAALLALALLVPALAAGETVVTSFYPIFLFARNLCDGLPGVTVRNLAAPDFGCLHDYQLTVADMKALAGADVFLINGAGMEEYLVHVYDALPDLRVVDASEGVELLEEDEDHHAHDEHDEHEDHDDLDEHDEHDDDDGHGHHHDLNPHIWMSVGNAVQMARNLAKGLQEALPQHAETIGDNLAQYLARLETLDAELTETLAPVAGGAIVTFHEAFPYFADAYGLEIAAVMAREPGDPLSAREMMDLVRLERELGNPPLFTEPQYSDAAARTVSEETGAAVYTLDPCVTGPDDPALTYYEDVMRRNAQTLLEALPHGE